MLENVTNTHKNEIFQNVTNIPVTKSIDNNSSPLYDMFDRVATNHDAYQIPNIVVH